ncbi:hypothetical protein [Pseudomonas sp. 2822-17]|uniref:hypothetical protein n=1 Tax=Pseudomonas sp. 2822-17 TaxID=1712678 RepID=UPI000C161E9D|nr:hypothetical protein [Pseudomonas sp. 2822-17]PIB54075.1 hypothetical protein AOA60_21805 [Pseudomonas sp. 2822-17]
MGDVEKILVDFVEGNMKISEFKNIIINTPSIEKFLKDDPELPNGTYIGPNTYDYICNEGWMKIGNKEGGKNW